MDKLSFNNVGSSWIIQDVIKAIQDNKAYLSEIDGKIGDGDHGINMNKGFTMAGERITAGMSLSEAMKVLGDTLLLEIGGSMGPIYGTFFRKSAKVLKSREEIDASVFGEMLDAALAGIMDIGGAREGDKTLVDCLSPSVKAFHAAVDEGNGFKAALVASAAAAEAGKEATREMIARVGRASRLGERSIGVLDAGATSCCIILQALYKSVAKALQA